jgi:hypothetical protein
MKPVELIALNCYSKDIHHKQGPTFDFFLYGDTNVHRFSNVLE